MAQEVLSKEGRFEWIHKSKTLLTELGRIKNPATMIEIADAISTERQTARNQKPWPTAQMLRRTVRQWRVGQKSAGSYEELVKEMEELIRNYRQRHPKLQKRHVTRALRYLLFIYKGMPVWANNEPDRIVRHPAGFFEVESSWHGDEALIKEWHRRNRGKELLKDKKHRFRNEI